ncbi:MAG TPA: thiol:disulfide interchange protein DsbA/DsbL [Xanthomonadaceae bacterium]|nr:thiol:disulfide interchange protein DsbA/DsbL [Xanthomonadaceae bacterium]
MQSSRFASWKIMAASTLLAAMACIVGTAGAAGVKNVTAQAAQSAGPAPVEGTDYFLIDSPDSVKQGPIKGAKIEVVEVFGYGCPICSAFQPHLADWEKTLPADVHFSYLPAAFGQDPEHCWDDFARAYYAAQSMGVQTKSHDGIYKEVFDQNRLAGGCASIPSLYTDYGVDEKLFASTMQSFVVTGQIGNAHEQVMRWGVDGTPTMIVDGKYRAPMTRAGGASGLLHTVDWLIAKQRPLHAKQPMQPTKKH